jgi:REP element-mobilizing transposase RayT
MRLTVIGEIAGKYWREIQNHFPFVKLGEFVIMPNHLHGIVVIDKEGLHDNTFRVGNESYTGSTMGSGADVETRQCLVSTKILPLSSSTIPTTASTMKPAMGRCIGQNRFQNQGKNTLSSVIGSYKSMVTKHARHINPDFAWQGRFYDHIIRDDAGYVKISEYIINNPVNWEQDKEYNG